MSYQAKNFLGTNSTIRKYRELFDANDLPDVYNGLMYFRYSQAAADFFDAARSISVGWDYVKPVLNKCHEENPSTDVLYALAALKVALKSVCQLLPDFHTKSWFCSQVGKLTAQRF